MAEISIEEIFSTLTQEEAVSLENLLISNLYDKDWCLNNDIDYSNPDIEKAREVTYIKYYKQKKKYGR